MRATVKLELELEQDTYDRLVRLMNAYHRNAPDAVSSGREGVLQLLRLMAEDAAREAHAGSR